MRAGTKTGWTVEAAEGHQAFGRSDRWELRDGELIEMGPVNFRHGGLAVRIGARLEAWAQVGRMGAVGVATGYVLHRNPDTLLGPDVSFIRAERAEAMPPDKFVEGPPDLAVEILSPSNRPGEMDWKVQQYLAAGAALVWVVDGAQRRVTVYEAGGAKRDLGPGDTLAAPDLLPGFQLPLADLFG